MEDADRADAVAQILDRDVALSDFLGAVVVLALQRLEQSHGTAGRKTDRAGREGTETEVAEVIDRGALTNAADDYGAVDALHHFGQQRILFRVISHHSVLDGANQSIIHELAEQIGRQITLVLDVDDDFLAVGLREVTQAGCYSVRGHRKGDRQYPRRRNGPVPQDGDLVL